MRRAALLILLCLFSLQIEASSETCRPELPFQGEWVGGDAIYSTRLDDQRVAWFFGDSFIGIPVNESRATTKMVGNSVAISKCVNGVFSVDYYWQTENGNPIDFFPSRMYKIRYWPLDSFMANGTLNVLLLVVKELHHDTPFGFELQGVKLARISNPYAPPSLWQFRYVDIIRGTKAFPGVSVAISDSHAYLMTVVDQSVAPAGSRHPIIMTRLPLDQLDQPEQALEYYAIDGQWKRGLTISDSQYLFLQGHTEMSLRYHEDKNLWTVTHPSPAPYSGQFVMRASQSLVGPWSDFVPIYDVPEMDRSNPQTDKQTFCYAPKEQTSYDTGSPDTFWLTYICNSFNVSRVINSVDIYYPRVEEVHYPF